MSVKVLIACECSGVVRRAFAAQGIDAYSCDLEASRDNSPKHLQCDIRDVLGWGWQMMIAHPPCTYLSYAGARWWQREGMYEKQVAALELFNELLNAPIPHICVENPRGLPSKLIRKPDDIVEPFEFGDPYKKRTYLWLKELPPLMRTLTLTDYETGWTEHRHGSYERSKTSEGIAAAMAKQWGGYAR